MSHRIQLRRDKAAFWAQADPVLAQGELAWSTDTGELKIGDGTTPWSELPNILAGNNQSPSDGIVFKDPLEDNWVFEHPYPASTESSGGPASGGISFDDSDPENVTEIQISKEFAGQIGSDATEIVTYFSIHNIIAVHDLTRGGVALFLVNSGLEDRAGHLMLYVDFIGHQENNPLGTLDGTTGAIDITLGMAYRVQNGVRVWQRAFVDFPFWDNMSEYEPNTFYYVNHEAGDDDEYEYRQLFFSADGLEATSITPQISQDTLIIKMRGDTENEEPEDVYYNEDSDRAAALKAIIKSSDGFYKTAIDLGGSPQNSILFKHGGAIEESRVIFAFTGSAAAQSETFPEIFVHNSTSTNNRLDREWMDNLEFAFINKSDSTVILDPANAGIADLPSVAYVSITFDKVYTLLPGEFVLLRYDHDSEIFRQEKQAGGNGISQADLDNAVAPLAVIPKPLSVPIGFPAEVTHTGTGWEPFSQLGAIPADVVTQINAGTSMVLEINLDYYIKPNGTQPLVRLKMGNIEVKLPSGNIPGVDSFLYFHGMVTLFISKPGADLQIKAMTRFRSYESFAGGALQDDLVYFPGDYLGNDDYTSTGGLATDGAWNATDPWIQFNADLGIKAGLEKVSGQYALAF
ncbi:hyaluronate lyase N-terminal domain-containing protein [Algoriphagus marincola]|uniref:hyaluronate lyase N-terminal domain-containing protein n=1 Tax=Algoriphagus marincola TaxID=264027 RepID=UPI00040C3317|nr:hypothetical protein [Algoriphagus marincola]